MPEVEGAYCATEDMRTGDIAPPSYTTKAQYVSNAAEEIEAALGHLYDTPFVVDSTVPKNRPTVLFLKKLNWLLASGRFIFDVAAAGEHESLHALGKRYLDEAMGMLADVKSEELVLTGATKLESEQKGFTGPMIQNEDPESLVEGFYRRQRPGLGGQLYPYQPPVMPYGR